MTVSVRTTARADRHIAAASDWWHEHRPRAPSLFDDELADAFALLAELPGAGRQYPHPEIAELRRLLLSRTRYHVYYVHDVTVREVVVLAVWSAVRGRAPLLT
ncbi:type II toxin-antitoxin system RelE/ParE family toxin [Haliangium sp.]|uniref:type II toxin-antitoxin system RelE/ParE family toxin n=1 Tax=Haliangium sp. TaxID=2663208 RepID=UPI003D0CF396